MARIRDITNADLIKRFEIACFKITNYPKNKACYDEMRRCEEELARRLDVTQAELERIREDV